MKIVNWILTAIFILFAYWQLNDPDPQLWVPIYLFPAIVCAFAALGKPLDRRILWVGFVPLTVFMLTYIPDFVDWVKMGMPSVVETMKANKPYVELTREFGGLVIVVGVVAWHLTQLRIKRLRNIS